MIWVAMLLLIALAAWFIISGINERRWVLDHLDNETVAADKGLLPNFDALNDSSEPEERYSVAGADSRIGRFATKAKDKTAAMSDAIERRTSTVDNRQIEEAKRQKRSERGNALTGPDSFIEKTANRISQKSSALIEKIPSGRMESGSKITERLNQFDDRANSTN